MNIQALLSEKVYQVIVTAGAPAGCEPQVRQLVKVQFDDYQTNGMMATAKELDMAPRQLAEQVLAHSDLNGIASRVEIASPGFINIFLDPAFLTEHIRQALVFDRLGIAMPEKQAIVVNHSMPNVAKEIHVDHLYSTIIGDTAVHTLEFLSHKVICASHAGDWGIQFGMLIAWLEKQQQESADEIEPADLEDFYHDAKEHYGEDEEFTECVRDYVVKLQSGDEYFHKMWCRLVNATMTQNQTAHDHLNVTLTHNDIVGENLHNPMLPGIVADLKVKGLAVESEGATIVFLDEFKNKEGEPMGVIIQKEDGGYLYTITDIICAKYRHETLHADHVLHYTDSRQHQYLVQAWAIVRRAGYVPEPVPLKHHMLGMMLGKDDKPLKTRAGGTVRLTGLLDEVLKRARCLVTEKNPDMPADKLGKLANAVGIGAVKYVDFSRNHTTGYIFDWDNMLVFGGNTTLYMQYVYMRVLSVFREAEIDEEQLAATPMTIRKDCEAQLTVRLLQLEETPTVVARESTSHVMCTYLYGLVGLFSGFYEHCPTLSAEDEEVCNSHLKLAQLMAKTLKLSLDTLGTEIVERM